MTTARAARPPRGRPFRGALTHRRQIIGLVIAVAGLAAVTCPLILLRNTSSIPSDVLVYQLLIVVVALVGGLWPALLAAIGAGFLLDFLFVSPLYTVRITEPSHLFALVIFLVVACLVSLVVDQAARRSQAAARSAAEAELLATVAGGVLRGSDAVTALVDELRHAFGMTRVTLDEGGVSLYTSERGEPEAPDDEARSTRIDLGGTAGLILVGAPLAASDRRILDAFVSQLRAALERRSLAAEAEEMRPLAAADRMRSALLAAVGHDLRRPLAAATAAVTSLRSREVRLSEPDREELLETAEESLTSLASLVTDLLDVSRLQAGVLGVTLEPVALDELVQDALDELHLAPAAVTLRFETTPAASADAALLKRVVVNLLANALRFSPAGTPPSIATGGTTDRVRLRVIDHGPGIPQSRRDEVFLPFQRLGDTDNTAGVGLGLALAKGFVEGMGGTLTAEDTRGGGLTMVIELEALR